jgi:hypothetical protein
MRVQRHCLREGYRNEDIQARRLLHAVEFKKQAVRRATGRHRQFVRGGCDANLAGAGRRAGFGE